MIETNEYRPCVKQMNMIFTSVSDVRTVEYGSQLDASAIKTRCTDTAQVNTKTCSANSSPTPEHPISFKQRMDRLKRLSDEVISELPDKLFEHLHGGVSLSEISKLHPSSDPRKPLYILGEYCNSNATGRHIMLYGGSIERTYGRLPDNALKKELDRIIKHELTHHWESLSGTSELEIYDANRISNYKHELDKDT